MYLINVLDMINILKQLYRGEVIVYPTESVFGLGCDPDNEIAVRNLLKIKGRSWKKGLILVAANYKQLIKYVDDSHLSKYQKLRVFSTWPGPVTWVFPARLSTPVWLTGQFTSIAVRVSNCELIKRLCLSFGKPLISTSANLTGFPPIQKIDEIHSQLGLKNVFIVNEKVLSFSRPSKILDAITGSIIRE